MSSPKFLLLLFSATVSFFCTAAFSTPNVIYILADDLGYGDLSCYGQQTLQTPHLDRLAENGMRFTSHYAGATVCAPSRYVLMTGKHSGRGSIRDNGYSSLPADEFTLAKLFKGAGYQTACIGKWGVGRPPDNDDPARAGFDEFYGYLNMFHAHNYYPEFMIHNGKREPLRNEVPDFFKDDRFDMEGRGVATKKIDYAPQLIHDNALNFIRSNKDNSFFLYYALNIPHANNEGTYDWSESGERIINPNANGMAVHDLGVFSDEAWPIQEKGFARMIQYIDDWVGEIVALVAELGLSEDTVIMFSSDNGPHHEGNHDHAFFDSNGNFQGYKRDLYDGGTRVPFIASWPGKIPPKTESALMSGFWDMMPTMAEILGMDMPDTDGISILPELTGNSHQQNHHEFLYWEFPERRGKQAVLYLNQWKAIRVGLMDNKSAPVELYDITWDIAEQHDQATVLPGLAAQLHKLMMDQHTPFNENWDLTQN